MSLSYPFRFVTTKVITSDTPYGSCINADEAPVFSYLGLGEKDALPSPAYSHIAENHVEAMLALHHFGGLTPQDAEIAHHWVEFVEMGNHDVRVALFRALGYSFPMESSDKICAVVHRGTKELLCYYFYVCGDGTSALFSVVHSD
jgi:hypothetical protein